MSDNMNYLYTAGAYAALFGAGYAIYQISTSKTRRRIASQAKSIKSTEAIPRKEDRKKKQRMETFASDTQEASKKASKAAGTDAEKQPESQSWADTAARGTQREDDADNKEFAKRLAKAQEGFKPAAKSDTSGKQSQKSVKQSRASKMEKKSNNEKVTVVPSTADEDRSPAEPPVVKAADPGGVADMLEPAPAAPSVLRLTNTQEEKPKNKKAKVPEPTETKKQRQNRKKAEAAKAVREDAEKERKVLEEAQRRTARIAEGRAAKDGSQFTNASVSKWNQGAPNGGGSKPNGDQNVFQQPLDTWETNNVKPVAVEQAKPNKSSNIEDSWVHALPSEEEQMEMLKDDADDWNEVKTKSSKKPKKTTVDNVNDDVGSKPVAASKPAAAPQQDKPTKAAPKSTPARSFGAFSALTSKDDPADEVEEEWDV